MKKMTREELYQNAVDLTVEIYRWACCDPKAESFELSVEIRKAAQDTARHLSPELNEENGLDAASGSAARLECLLLIARDLAFFPKVSLDDYRERAEDLGAAARKLMTKLRASGS